MRILIAVMALSLMASAQPLPDAPSAKPAKGEKLELGEKKTGTKRLGVPFVVVMAAMTASTIADAETTVAGLDRCGSRGREMNSWIYGKNPTRARLYGVKVPVTAFFGVLAYLIKKDDKHDSFGWWLGPGIWTSLQTGAAIHNHGVCR